MKLLSQKNILTKTNKKGQATVELAIMGTIVIMLLAYLLQQGYLYNARQALEMYTFRKALELSKRSYQEKAVNLTVIRDVMLPSFFTGLNRQRLMASASVEYNPWIVYTPKKPQYTSGIQLIQLGEGMIQKGSFFQVPPTKIRIKSDESDDWLWMNSSVREIDPQTEEFKGTSRVSGYSNITRVSEDASAKRAHKTISSQDIIPLPITFEDKRKIEKDYWQQDWEGEYREVEVDANTIPKDIKLTLEEKVERAKDVQTPHF